MKKSLVLLVFLALLTACSDRERVNCERVKNKAPGVITSPTEVGTGLCA